MARDIVLSATLPRLAVSVKDPAVSEIMLHAIRSSWGADALHLPTHGSSARLDLQRTPAYH